MSKWARWTKKEDALLLKLLKGGNHTFPEIAEIIGRNRFACQMRAKHEFGLGNPAYLKRRTKHKHLRRAVLVYFKRHSMEQTAKHFRLTMSELKSCLTVAYMDPKLKKIRKDKRRHDPWNAQELVFLSQHCGLQSRAWIAKKLKRGTRESVKERLAAFGSHSRYLNGMTLGLVRAFYPDPRVPYVLTKAGSPGPDGRTYARVVPWVVLEQIITRKPDLVDPTLAGGIRAMAQFQRFAHGTKGVRDTVRKLKQITRKR